MSDGRFAGSLDLADQRLAAARRQRRGDVAAARRRPPGDRRDQHRGAARPRPPRDRSRRCGRRRARRRSTRGCAGAVARPPPRRCWIPPSPARTGSARSGSSSAPARPTTSLLALAQALTGRPALATRERAYHGGVGLAREMTIQPHWHGGLSYRDRTLAPPRLADVRELPAPGGARIKGPGPDPDADRAALARRRRRRSARSPRR